MLMTIGRLPLTEYAVTKEIKRALEQYLNHMEALIKADERIEPQ